MPLDYEHITTPRPSWRDNPRKKWQRRLTYARPMAEDVFIWKEGSLRVCMRHRVIIVWSRRSERSEVCEFRGAERIERAVAWLAEREAAA